MSLESKQKRQHLYFEYALITSTFASNIKLKEHWPGNEFNFVLIICEYLYSNIDVLLQGVSAFVIGHCVRMCMCVCLY